LVLQFFLFSCEYRFRGAALKDRSLGGLGVSPQGFNNKGI